MLNSHKSPKLSPIKHHHLKLKQDRIKYLDKLDFDNKACIDDMSPWEENNGQCFI